MRFENSLMTCLAFCQQNAKKKMWRCSLLHHQQITHNDIIYKINDVISVSIYSRLKHTYVNIFLQATLRLLLKLASKLIWCYFVSNLQRYDTISAHVKTCIGICFIKTSVYRHGLYITVCNLKNIVSASLFLVPF